MIRSIFLAFLLALAGPVAAQVPVQPIMGLAGGPTGCLGLTVRDPSNASLVSLGCLNTADHTFRLTPSLLSVSGGGTALVDLHTAIPANGAFLSGLGTYLDYCSVTGCLQGPHLLTGSLFAATTRMDASAQEAGVAINFTSATGKATYWTPSTVYTVGQQVHAGNAGAIYEVTIAGTSASSGLGPAFCPTSTYAYCYGASGANASTGTDGSVTWKFIGAGINDGKTALAVAANVLPGAGHTWSMNTNLVINAGVGGVPMFGYELDTSNSNMDYAVGGPIMAGLFLNGAAAYPGTAAFYATMSGPVATYGWHYGMLFQGDAYIKDATIADATSASYVLYALGSPHTHAAVIRDDTNSTRSIQINGSHTYGIDMSAGTFGTAILLPASGFIGLNGLSNFLGYNGTSGLLTYGLTTSSNLMQIDNFGNMTLSGGLLTTGVLANTLTASGSVTGAKFSRPNTSPASSSSACTIGDEVADANYLYRCTATNTWKRAALSTW